MQRHKKNNVLGCRGGGLDWAGIDCLSPSKHLMVVVFEMNSGILTTEEGIPRRFSRDMVFLANWGIASSTPSSYACIVR